MRRAMMVLGAVSIVAAAPAGQVPTTAALVEQAGRYVDGYVEAFSAVVSQERQTQKLVRPDGSVHKQREIVADFLLVKANGTWPQAFRDVIEVDGKPVRNREDRLKKLFVDQPKTAPELAKAIAEESGRYNLGFRRVGTSPMLPILFLTPKVAEGVSFTGTAPALTFQETRTPSVLQKRGGGGSHDMPAHGRFEIDPATGRILSAEFTADNPDSKISATFTVRYAIDPKLEISVPVEATERYWQPAKPKDDVLEVRAVYSDFRKFQVTTGEQIKK